MIWNIIVTILAGALVGWLASKLMHFKGNFWLNCILGIVGSAVGRFVFGLIDINSKGKLTIGGILISVVGACIVVWVVRLITGKKK